MCWRGVVFGTSVPKLTRQDSVRRNPTPIASLIVVDPESIRIQWSGKMRQDRYLRQSGRFAAQFGQDGRMPTEDSVGITGTENQTRRRPQRLGFDGSCALRNYMHEQFAQEIARLSEQDAVGKAGEDAYVAAGFARHRHNHVRLLRRERVAKRVAWLRFEREAAALAARMSPGRVIEELHARGIERFDDLVERNAAGIVRECDLSSSLPVELAIAALKMVHRAFGIKSPIGS